VKKISVLLIIGFIWSLSFSFADVRGDELVRVGLNHDHKNMGSIVVTSKDSLALFASVDRVPVKIFECDRNAASFEKGTASRVNVVYNQRFGTFSELYNQVGTLKVQNAGAFYYYDAGWYLVLGRYDSMSQAKDKMSSFSGVSSGQLKTVSTGSDDVYLLVGGKALLAYSSISSDFFVASTNYPSSGVVTYNDKSYRGGIGANRSSASDMSVINYLMMDHYMYGILPKEMSGSWPKEALKAQAVVARNFAITNFNKHADEGYDLCNTTDCQVYGGFSVEAIGSNLAVDETAGDLLYYNDDLVVGYYHSNSGGRTASIENVWTSSVPYLVSVEDPYSVGSPNTDWTVMMTPAEIASKLSEKNYFIGTLKNIRVDEVALDGRIQSISFIGTKGTATLKKEEMRKVFGYVKFKSIWFDILTGGELAVTNRIDYSKVAVSRAQVFNGRSTTPLVTNSTLSVLGASGRKTIDMTPSTYTFTGHGFGHGIGMSQWGAKKMAEEGFNYKDILYHYYSGTQIINN
jgi:stage II sporulation protein D